MKNVSNYSINGIIILIPLAVWVFLYFGYGFNGLYGQDGYEYYRYQLEIFQSLKSFQKPNPFFWPIGYPLTGAVLLFLSVPKIISLQVISVFSLVGTSVFLWKIFKNAKHSGTYIIVCFLFSPVVFRSGFIVMSDILACFFTIGCYYYINLYSKVNQNRLLYFSIIFASLAVMTRYPSIIIIVCLYLGYSRLLIRNMKFYNYLVGFLLFLLFFIPNFVIQMDDLNPILNHNFLREWSFTNLFNSEFHTAYSNFDFSHINFIYVLEPFFHPKFLSIGLFLIYFYIKGKYFSHSHLPIFLCLSVYLLFIGGLPFQNPRFLVLIFPFILILFFLPFQDMLNFINDERIRGCAIFLLCFLQLTLSIYGFRNIWQRFNVEKQIMELVSPYQNSILYSFDIDLALKNTDMVFDYKNLWEKEYDNFEEGSLILFNPEKFQEQWRDKNPMKNWDHLNQSFRLHLMDNRIDGWGLWMIGSK